MSLPPAFSKPLSATDARPGRYLLEKVRLIKQSEGERNFHVFYQLINGLGPEDKAELGLGSVTDYHYLNHSGCFARKDGDDGVMFAETQHAMRVIGMWPRCRLVRWVSLLCCDRGALDGHSCRCIKVPSLFPQ